LDFKKAEIKMHRKKILPVLRALKAMGGTKRKRGVQTPLPVFTLARAPVKNSTQEPPFVNSSDLEARESPNEARYSACNRWYFSQKVQEGKGGLNKEPRVRLNYLND
jgi:hypothetical protein